MDRQSVGTTTVLGRTIRSLLRDMSSEVVVLTRRSMSQPHLNGFVSPESILGRLVGD
jgi:hypothetical protein